MRFFPAAVAILILLSWIQPAAAADVFLNFKGSDDIMTFLEPAPRPEPKTRKDFANLYYETCVEGNESDELSEMVALHCACTSATMIELMDEKQMALLSEPTPNGRLQRARLINFAFVPCLEEPVKSLVLDNCLYDSSIQRSLRHERRVCHCLANGMAEFVTERGERLLPGRGRAPFGTSPEDLLRNPLGELITSKGFNMRSQYFMPKCMSIHEFPSAQAERNGTPQNTSSWRPSVQPFQFGTRR